MPYGKLLLKFTDGRTFTVNRSAKDDHITLAMSITEQGAPTARFKINSDEFETEEGQDSRLPPWIIRVDRDRWLDERSGIVLTRRELERRHRLPKASERSRQAILDQYPALAAIVEDFPPTFVDTKRLDTPIRAVAKDDYTIGGKAVSRSAAGRIGQYIGEIRTQITDARRESLDRSQQADERFASNLLKRSRRSVRHDDLVRNYERLSTLSDELSENGLAGKTITVRIPERATPTEKRVLDLFLQDWERKLEPLLPVHRKMTSLTRIVNNKFIGKTIGFDSRGGVIFLSADGAEIRVDQLSSGEQHLLAVFIQLLFSAREGSTVLIDEPEISLHAAWKHAFIDDLEEVAGISKLTVVLATHSTAIINGRWELVQELASGPTAD